MATLRWAPDVIFCCGLLSCVQDSAESTTFENIFENFANLVTLYMQIIRSSRFTSANLKQNPPDSFPKAYKAAPPQTATASLVPVKGTVSRLIKQPPRPQLPPWFPLKGQFQSL